jgi:hypothetical protein
MEQQNAKVDTMWGDGNNVWCPRASEPDSWAGNVTPPFLICPSDDSPTNQLQVGGYSWIFGRNERPKGLTSYVANARVFGRPNRNNNANAWAHAWDNSGSRTKMSSFTDGNSNRICVAETPMIIGESITRAIAWGVQVPMDRPMAPAFGPRMTSNPNIMRFLDIPATTRMQLGMTNVGSVGWTATASRSQVSPESIF